MQTYKYLVHVEGNCAALRLKELLSAPSAIFKVTSLEHVRLSAGSNCYIYALSILQRMVWQRNGVCQESGLDGQSKCVYIL